jgi:hypothetical protein
MECRGVGEAQGVADQKKIYQFHTYLCSHKISNLQEEQLEVDHHPRD